MDHLNASGLLSSYFSRSHNFIEVKKNFSWELEKKEREKKINDFCKSLWVYNAIPPPTSPDLF